MKLSNQKLQRFSENLINFTKQEKLIMREHTLFLIFYLNNIKCETYFLLHGKSKHLLLLMRMCIGKFLKTYYTIENYVRPRENTLESKSKLLCHAVALMVYRNVFEVP